MTKLQKVLQFGYLPRTFTSSRVRKHVLFTTALHKTSLLPISRLFLHQTHEQWGSRVDVLHCNVVRQQVQISGGIFADEQGTRLCHKDEWACRRWSATMILLSLSSTWAIPVELERWVWPLTLSPPLQAPIQELKAFPEPRAEFETDSDECWFIKLLTKLERYPELYSTFITYYCFSVLSLSVFSYCDC